MCVLHLPAVHQPPISEPVAQQGIRTWVRSGGVVVDDAWAAQLVAGLVVYIQESPRDVIREDVSSNAESSRNLSPRVDDRRLSRLVGDRRALARGAKARRLALAHAVGDIASAAVEANRSMMTACTAQAGAFASLCVSRLARQMS